MGEGNRHTSPGNTEPQQDRHKGVPTTHIIIKISKVKGKERILKATREN